LIELWYADCLMAAKAHTQRFETEIPVQLFAEIQSLVNTGWFRSIDDVVLDALRRFLDSHREELMEAFLRQDVEWGLHGRD
jgi:Arc/MetJ-type ribon-helix-helix transcriptional regulator